MNIGWIGMGRMGTAMVERLLQTGQRVQIWNRTQSKALPLKEKGAVVMEKLTDLRGCDVVFTMVATGKDLHEILFGTNGLAADAATCPGIIVDCSTIGVEESREAREKLSAQAVQYLAAPVSGNPHCVAALKLSSVVSGPKEAFERVAPLIKAYAARGVAYVGEGERARICKIAHNVFLAVVIENLIEVTLLAQKAGVPRHAFLQFMNNSALGSIFTQYKSPALVNLDFKTTFTIGLTRKDVDLGLEVARDLGVAMPVTAAMREVLQSHIGMATLQGEPEAYLAQDFSTLIETLAINSGLKLTSEAVHVPSGLEV